MDFDQITLFLMVPTLTITYGTQSIVPMLRFVDT